jgi:cob(I)alamin adenosyltransferase
MTIFLRTAKLRNLRLTSCNIWSLIGSTQYSTTRTRFSKDNAKTADSAKSEGFPKIYTKTGDSGLTSTFTGERRPKDDIIFQALGAVDELTSMIGLVREFALEKDHDYTEHLQRVQCILQDVNACIATPFSSAREVHLQRTEFDSSHTKELEDWIDSYTSQLPPLENFILPGGGKASSTLHVSRTICRRAERLVVPLVKEQQINAETLKYLNR